MQSTSRDFKANAKRAIADGPLQEALARLVAGFPLKRQLAKDRLPEFDALRDRARAIKDHTLANLDHYLEAFEAQVRAQGGSVHWAKDAAEANAIIVGICQAAGAATVTKSKSMIGEEIAINEALEAAGMRPVETDLGEYIIQLRHEPPSHIIAPAIHLSKAQVEQTFREVHASLPPGRNLDEPRALLEEARNVLRRDFLVADVGLTGANMLVAETGSIVVVTNEGNADLTMTLAPIHIAIASIEKVVPTLEDATTILRVLARSATGQDMSVYTTLATGPKRPGDLDGPEAFHVVLLDNGRSKMVGGDFHEMLCCIRCGACLNHCPVYAGVGGHAYGWVYSGPMGAVLIPGLLGLDEAQHLPNASTFCGKCEDICPMHIPLPAMMRQWRNRQFSQGSGPAPARWAMILWAALARRPALYRLATQVGVGFFKALAGKRGRFNELPFTGGWTAVRDLPAPEGGTFMAQWKAQGQAQGKSRGAAE